MTKNPIVNRPLPIKSVAFRLLLLVAVVFRLAAAQGVATIDNSCVSPNGEVGVCQSAHQCTTLINLLQNYKSRPIERSVADYLRASQCVNGQGRQPYVCCVGSLGSPSPGVGQSPSQRTKLRPVQVKNPSTGNGRMLPERGECGIESLGTKLFGGKDAGIDEYPWMAILEYQKFDRTLTLSCGGSLINRRYVVTAAHCVVGDIERQVGKLVNIRLGEYNTDSDTDCVGNDCADPVMNYGVDRIIVPPMYETRNKNRYSDIALVRLSSEVTYSDFVRPICLPLPHEQPPTEGDWVTVAGWGRTINARRSAVKQKVFLPIADQERCYQLFASRGVFISDRQICAGGTVAEDSCDGDSGGPMMRPVEGVWILEGIVSFGRGCGNEGWPGIYTRVPDFAGWIRANLRP